jgi:GntR family transcriptional regulator, transcriptional repressor for pyruvate dehydrogenase complex
MNVVQGSPRPTLKPKLSEAVTADIERRILNGLLPPGKLLPTESQLGAELGVSRTVVRDAIRTLAARGLVEVRQGSGTRVTAHGVAAFEQALTTVLLRSDLSMGDVIDARAALEMAMVGLAAPTGLPEDWDQLQSALDGLVAAIAAKNWESAHHHHLEFHLDILRAVHLPALELVLRPMHQLVMLSSTPPSPDNPGQWELEAHVAILAALRRGDAEAARGALDGHYQELKGADYADFRARLFREAPTVQAIVERHLAAVIFP